MQIQYELQEVKIENKTFQLKVVTNIDELFEDLISKNKNDKTFQDERIPYWADLWHSAIALTEHLLKHHANNLKNHSVLEIGCGLGLPAIVAASLGAKVIFTDYLEDSLLFAKQNLALNTTSAHAQFELMDWAKPNMALKSSIILASDVAYERKNYDLVIDVITKLCNENGLIILSEPNRDLAKPFIEKLKQINGEIKAFDYDVFHKNIKQKITVYEIRPN